MSDPMSSSEAAFDKSLSKYDEAARNFDDSPSKPAPDAGPSEVQLWAREYLDTPVALLLLYPIWFVVVKYTDVILNLHILTLAACVIAARRWGVQAIPALMVLGMPFLIGWTHTEGRITVTPGGVWTIGAMVLLFRTALDPDLVTAIRAKRWARSDWAILLALCSAGTIRTEAFSMDDVVLLEQLAAQPVFEADVGFDPMSYLLPVLMIMLGLLQVPRGPVILCIVAGMVVAFALAPFWPVPTSYGVYLTAFPGLWPSQGLEAIMLFLISRIAAQSQGALAFTSREIFVQTCMRILLLPALILMCLGVEFSVLFAQSGQSAFNLGQHVNGYFIGFWGVFAATILTMTYRVMETRRDTIYVFMMGAAAFGVLTTLYILFGVMSSGNTLTESFLDTLTRALPFLFGSEIEPIIVDQLVLLDVFDVFSVNWSPSLFIADAGFAAMLHGVGVVLAYRWLAKPSAAYIGPPPLGNRTAPRGIITALISPMLGWLAIGLMVFNLSYVAAANWFIDTAPEVDLSSVISPKELADEVARFNDMRLMIEMIEESAPKDYELPELITALTNEISENFGEIGFIQTEGPSEQSNTSALPGRGEISFLFDTNFDLITRLEQLVSEEVSALALFRVTPSEQSTAD